MLRSGTPGSADSPSGLFPAGFGILWPERSPTREGPGKKVRSRWPRQRRRTRCTSAAGGSDAADGNTRPIVAPPTASVIADEIPGRLAGRRRPGRGAAKKAYDETWSDATPGERIGDAAQAGRPRSRRTPRTSLARGAERREACSAHDVADIPVIADHLRFFAAAARVLEGLVRGRVHEGVHEHPPPRAHRRRRPDRAVELPAVMSSWKLGPALAAGNTIVIKPAEN